MTKLVVGVDCNGLIVDHNIKPRAIKATSGVDIPFYEFGTKGEMIGRYHKSGLTHEVYEEAMKYAFEDPRRFWELAELVPEAKESLCKLANAGHEVNVVSSCRGLQEGWMLAFLAEHGIPITDFISVRNDKSDIYALCHYVIDDEARHFNRTFLNENPTVRPILMLPAPGETGCEVRREPPRWLHPRVCVARGWQEVLGYIPELQSLAA